MNDKQAKRLRRYVESLSPNLDLGVRVYMMHQRTGTIINHPQSARGIYQQLKKQEGNHVPHISGG